MASSSCDGREGTGVRFDRRRDLVGEIRVDSVADDGGVVLPPPEVVLRRTTGSVRD